MELHHPNYIKNGITSSADKWKVTFSCLSFMIIVRIAITSFFRDCDVLKGLRFSINSQWILHKHSGLNAHPKIHSILIVWLQLSMDGHFKRDLILVNSCDLHQCLLVLLIEERQFSTSCHHVHEVEIIDDYVAMLLFLFEHFLCRELSDVQPTSIHDCWIR